MNFDFKNNNFESMYNAIVLFAPTLETFLVLVFAFDTFSSSSAVSYHFLKPPFTLKSVDFA
jgi:hypothetical protein